MKRIIGKIVTLVCLSTCLVGGIFDLEANAATWKSKTIYGQSYFKDAWEKTVT